MGGIIAGYELALFVAAGFLIVTLIICGAVRLVKLLPLFILLLSVSALAQSGHEITYRGPLTVIHEDPVTVTADNPGIFHYYITHDGQMSSIGDFTGGPQLGTYQTGTVVEATGIQQNNGSLKGAHIKPPAPAPQISIAGAQTTLAIVFNFSDYVVQPFTTADVSSALANASNFVLENSYDTAWLTPTVTGWLTIPDSITTCDSGAMATDAKAAATAAGFNLSNYTHYVYFFPTNSACGWGGLSVVGGSPTQSWINGTLGPGGTTLDAHVIIHELGHAFGLWHAHFADCGTASPICSSPSIIEYGDPIDTMGRVQTAYPDYNAFEHERLGWLGYGSLPTIQTATTTGTYTIYPLEDGVGPNAIKVLKSTDSAGVKTYYYIESRQAIGFDAYLSGNLYSTQNETTGLLFHLGTEGNGNTSDVIDMTPLTSTANGYLDLALVVGQSFQDSTAGVIFSPTSVTSTSASILITFGSSQSGSISCFAHPLAASYTAGNTSSVNIHVTDNSGNVVSGASVTQSLRKTNAATSVQSCTSNSGGDAVCTYKIKNPDPLGTWQATETVTKGTLSTSCSTNFLVN